MTEASLLALLEMKVNLTDIERFSLYNAVKHTPVSITKPFS